MTETRVDSRQYPERPIVGVGAVIVEAGKVLLVKRRYEPLAGRWSIPGGTLELGETLETASPGKCGRKPVWRSRSAR